MADNFNNDEMRQFWEKLTEGGGNFGRELDDLAKKNKSIAEEAEKNGKALKEFRDSMVGATGQMYKAMTSANDGTGKYSTSIEAAGSATKSFTKDMGGLARGVGVVIDLFAKLAGGVVKQNQEIVKTYRALSRVGDLGKSFDDIRQNMHDAGFSIDQSADIYTAAIEKAAPGLALFAGNVSDGSKMLHDVMVKELGKTEYVLQRFGYTQEELFGRTATFMGILGSSGSQRLKQDGDLFKITKEYLLQLGALSQITGQQREEAERKMVKDANDLRYQMFLKRLEDSGEAGKQYALNIRTGIANMPEELAEGAKSMMVNQGRVADEYGSSFMMSLGSRGYDEMMKAFKVQGKDFPEQFMKFMFQSSGTFNKQFDQFGNQIALGNDTMKDFMLTMNTWKWSLQGGTLDEQKRTEIMGRLSKIREDLEKTDIDQNTDRIKRERRVRNAYEDMEFQMSKVVLPALDWFTKALESLGEAMAEFAYVFSFHKIDVRDAFKQINSYDDVLKVVEDQTKKQAKLDKEELEVKEKIAKLERRRLTAIEERKRGGLTTTSDPKYYEADIASAKEELSAIQGKRSESQRMVQRARKKGDVFQADRVSETDYQLPQNYASRAFSAKQLSDIIKFTGGTGDETHFRQLDSATANAFVDMATEYQKLYGEKLQINSSFRSFEEQENVNPGTNPKAAAGKSLHNLGRALDLNSRQVQSLLDSGLLGKYGFNPLRGDPPHISYAQPEAKNGGIFSGSVKGYNVTLHGDEAVVPMNKGVTKQPLSSSSFADNREVMEIFTSIYDKLDTLVDLTRIGNGTTDEMLSYAKQA